MSFARGRALDCSITRVLSHVEHMRLIFSGRKSGSGIDLAAGEYVVATMKSYGLEASLQSFETFDSDAGEASLRLDGPDGLEVPCRPCLHVEPTPPDGLTAELIDVGAGAISDYGGKDASGKLVLVEVSYAPATPEKARIAAAKGAAGIILMNWGQDDSKVIPWRALKSAWGNPTSESWKDIPRIAGISISRASGIDLRKRLRQGSVRLYAKLTSVRVWRTLHQPIAWLHAPQSSPERDQFVIVSGHLDSWDPGVTDNITGMSVMLEAACTLARQRERLRRSAVFCFWNGHEVAEAAGSTYFVDSQWEAINRNAVAYLNIDSVGMKGASEFHVNACPELASCSRELADAVFGDGLVKKILPLRRVGDQSFFGVGVSAVTGRHSYSADAVLSEHGATLGWYNHTEFDTIEQVDPASLEQDLDWCARYIGVLTSEAVLPHRFMPRIHDLEQQFASALPAGDSPAQLQKIPEEIERLKKNVAWFDGFLESSTKEEDLRIRANRLVLRLARQLTFITTTATGRHGQDSYGTSTLSKPVPILACLDEYQALAPDSLQARLLETKLIRLRQTITDALELARGAIDDFRTLVQANSNRASLERHHAAE